MEGVNRYGSFSCSPKAAANEFCTIPPKFMFTHEGTSFHAKYHLLEQGKYLGVKNPWVQIPTVPCYLLYDPRELILFP
jgi:hypothetical protein